MPELITGEDFADLFTAFTRTAFRWEAQATYYEDYEVEPLRKWHAGEPDDLEWMEDWLAEIRGATRAGRCYERVRVYTEPPTDYLRWQQHVTPANVAAGEDVRVITEHQTRALRLPTDDFWLFDDELLARMHFTDNRWIGAEILTDAATVAQHRVWRDLAWKHSMPYQAYREQHFAERGP